MVLTVPAGPSKEQYGSSSKTQLRIYWAIIAVAVAVAFIVYMLVFYLQ
jgi:hypothetical protein